MPTHIFKEGDVVKLNKAAKKYHTCPKGRTNNRTAIILSIFGDDGETRMDRDLAGCLYWNLEDFIFIRRAGDKK